jgi:RecB family exonuclease
MDPIREYESFSALNQFGKCERLYELAHNPKVAAKGRFAATIMGSAVHKTIQALHEGGGLFDIEALLRDKVEDAILEKEFEPVQWGTKAPYDKEGRIKKALRIVTVYWALNQGVDIRSSERWFFLEIQLGNETVHLRGRFDQIISDKNGHLIVRELKTGADAPDPQVLERDLQIPLEAYSLKHGLIALEDVPYIRRDDPNFHIHTFEPTADPTVFECSMCHMKAEKVGRYPDSVIYYDLGGLDPGKREWDGGSLQPKRNPEIEITFSDANLETFKVRMVYALSRMLAAKRSGVFYPTGCHGVMSPCDGCQYANHCNAQVATLRTKIFNPMKEASE